MNATPNYKRKIDQSPAADAESKRMDMKITPTKEGLNNTNQTQSEREQSELDEIKAKGAPEWYIASLQRITRQFDEVNNRLSGFEITTNNEIADLKKTVEEQNKKILEQEAKLAEALDRLDKCEDYSRNSNLIFENVEERYQENTEKILLDIFKTNLKIDSEIQISDSHRLGKKVNAKPRPLIVRFVKVKDRKQVWAARRNLAGTKLIMKEHYSKGTDDARKTLYPYYRKAQKAPEVKKCRLFRDQLQIDGKSYGTADIVKLPHGLDQQRIHTVNKNGCTFFFSRDAPLSNFHRATFKVDGQEYNSSEQYYQVKKAENFCRDELAKKMLLLDNPAAIKQLSHKIKISEKEEKQWYDSYAKKVMMKGVFEKFNQNPALEKYLIESTETKMAEASRDPFFAIGMALSNPNIGEPSKWAGQNEMGNILEEVKVALKQKLGAK